MRCVEAFGVRVAINVGERALARAVEAVLPPTWSACESEDVAAQFSINRSPEGYDVTQDGSPIAADATLTLALQVLDSQVRLVIATNAPTVAFVHAGTVAFEGRAIVLPGRSFAGKTTLVAELIRRGAMYLSDEYAVLDEDGFVHPYPKPLSVRGPCDEARSQPSTETVAADFGAITADRAVPVGLVAATTYLPGASWSPQIRTRAQGALILLSNAFAARGDPERVLRVVRRAATSSVVLEGDRGDAGEVAEDLLARAAVIASR